MTIVICLILVVLPCGGLFGDFSVLRLIVLLWILLAQASLESLIGRRMRKRWAA